MKVKGSNLKEFFRDLERTLTFDMEMIYEVEVRIMYDPTQILKKQGVDYQDVVR